MRLYALVRAWEAHLEATKEERAGKPNESVENVGGMHIWPEMQVDITMLTDINSPEAVKRARIVEKIRLARFTPLCTDAVEQKSRLVNLVANHDGAKHKQAKQAVEDKQKGEDNNRAPCIVILWLHQDPLQSLVRQVLHQNLS